MPNSQIKLTKLAQLAKLGDKPFSKVTTTMFKEIQDQITALRNKVESITGKKESV